MTSSPNTADTMDAEAREGPDAKPWDDCKVAFGVDDIEAFEAWMEETDDGKGRLPAGWSLCETDGAGARYVVIFRIEGELLEKDGQAVAAILASLRSDPLQRPWETLSHANIAHVCFLIAIDNGGINRGRSVERWRRDYERFIEKAAAPLTEIDVWLGSLTEAQVDAVASGADDDAQPLLLTAPAFTDDLLNSYFDEVC